MPCKALCLKWQWTVRKIISQITASAVVVLHHRAQIAIAINDVSLPYKTIVHLLWMTQFMPHTLAHAVRFARTRIQSHNIVDGQSLEGIFENVETDEYHNSLSKL